MTGAELILGLSVIAIVTTILYLSIGIIIDVFFGINILFADGIVCLSVVAISITIMFFSLLASIGDENSEKRKQYNNGVCLKCGGNYEMYQAVGHGISTSYIYKCDNCGNTIELDETMD